jgi:hypothetical protein
MPMTAPSAAPGGPPVAPPKAKPLKSPLASWAEESFSCLDDAESPKATFASNIIASTIEIFFNIFLSFNQKRIPETAFSEFAVNPEN